ncbi:hypothetical protein PAPYR_4097 [Paratrimastix pyriformis]|uniref:U-box domain-containing protein n=1 Tax=Paratrimastix pyriformis TaxID=342808 RepID=A0ABQ8UQ88_9EUKA|nr:hypothetical protein PAPYR_4097 [Paratrimastix pyriformis]
MGNFVGGQGQSSAQVPDTPLTAAEKDEIYYLMMAAARHAGLTPDERQVGHFRQMIRTATTAKLLRESPKDAWEQWRLPPFLQAALMEIVGSPLSANPSPSGTPATTVATQSAVPPVAGNPNDPPPDFLCPITRELMRDPVVAADGHSYDRVAITEWMAHSTGAPKSPLTNQPLDSQTLTENFALRRLIREWLESHPQCAPTPEEPEEAQPQGQQPRPEEHPAPPAPAPAPAPAAPAHSDALPPGYQAANLAERMLGLEMAIKWPAFNRGWRMDRDRWVDQFKALLMHLLDAFAPEAFQQIFVLVGHHQFRRQVATAQTFGHLQAAMDELEKAILPPARAKPQSLSEPIMQTLNELARTSDWLPADVAAGLRTRLEAATKPADFAAVMMALEAALFPDVTLRSLEEDWAALSTVVQASLELLRAGGAAPRGPPVVYPKIHMRLHLLERRTPGSAPLAEVRVPVNMTLSDVLRPLIANYPEVASCSARYQGRNLPGEIAIADLRLPEGVDIDLAGVWTGPVPEKPETGLVSIVLRYEGLEEAGAPVPELASYHPECPRSGSPYASGSYIDSCRRTDPPHWFHCNTCKTVDLCGDCVDGGKTPGEHQLGRPRAGRSRVDVRDPIRTLSEGAGPRDPIAIVLQGAPMHPSGTHPEAVRALAAVLAKGAAARQQLLSLDEAEGAALAAVAQPQEGALLSAPDPTRMAAVTFVNGRTGDRMARLFVAQAASLEQLFPVFQSDFWTESFEAHHEGRTLLTDVPLAALNVLPPPPAADQLPQDADSMARAPAVTIQIQAPERPVEPAFPALHGVRFRVGPLPPARAADPQAPFCTLELPPHAAMKDVVMPMLPAFDKPSIRVYYHERPVPPSRLVTTLPFGPNSEAENIVDLTPAPETPEEPSSGPDEAMLAAILAQMRGGGPAM